MPSCENQMLSIPDYVFLSNQIQNFKTKDELVPEKV